MSTLAQLAHVSNPGPISVIEKLTEAARDVANGAQKTLPLTTLFLKSGLSLRGHVLAVSDDAGPRSVVFLMHNAEQAQDISYVLVSEVAGLAVHGAINLIETLSDGRIAKPMTAAPTAADLQRMAKGVIDEINASIEGRMNLDVQDLGAQATTELLEAQYLSLRDLYAVLKKMAGEELSRRILQEQGFQFSLRVADTAGVQMKRNACMITVGSTAAGAERVSREMIRAYLEETA